MNIDEFQTLLNACSSTREWEMLTESILIPEEWLLIAFAQLSELTAQEVLVSVWICLSKFCSVTGLDVIFHLPDLLRFLYA